MKTKQNQSVSRNDLQKTEISDSLVRKIQLLLNLAARPEGNEAEAAAAMSRAMDLLAQHNLDLATVQDKVVEGGTAAREAESKRDYAVSKRSAMYKWQQNLVRTIAEANFCVYWIAEVKELVYVPPSKRTLWQQDEATENGGKCKIDVKRHRILGRVVNTTAVMIMVDYLLDTIERLLPYPQQERLSRNANIWREGCADRLCERITAKAAAMKKADYATQGEAAYTTAIQVAGLAKKEEAANYDHQWGAGAWAKQQARNAEMDLYWSDEAVAKREAERTAKKAAERAALLASETPAQRKKREAEEAKAQRRAERENEAYSRRYWREQDKKEERRNSGAYRQGRSAGENISLDGQLSTSTTKGLK